MEVRLFWGGTMETLEEIVLRARDGDHAAFEEIVRRFSRRAVATAHFIAGDLHAGEEAAQDAFVTAWRKLGDLRDPRGFRSWFGTILARLASRSRPPRLPSLEKVPEPVADPARNREEDRLPAVAERLKPKYRQVLALRYVDGLSHREISEALGIPVARVKSRLHDGRELVRRRLREKGIRR
jgi:RNA polymerase sigma-70 factor (ECF subfamily)